MEVNDIKVSCGEEGGSYFITVDETRYKCSYAESVILSHFLNNKGKFFSRDELASIGWPGKLVSKNSVPVSIANLRKIFKNHTKIDVISNEKNKGYVVQVDKIKFIDINININREKSTDAITKDSSPELLDAFSESKINRTKLFVSKIALYPLLFVNIALLLIVFFFNHTGLEPSKVNVINNDDYIAVFTGDSQVLAQLESVKSSQESMLLRFQDIEEDLKLAKHENKNILFINSSGDRVVIDCLVNDQLVSFSGDDIKKIVSELNEKGCKL
ncbi:winged helix-turn-helix domain-containing protein [Vibrio parahaemolyticus]|nr:winged helix-turn-helix domain-containing protein [Vibrio parahaemolyticus]